MVKMYSKGVWMVEPMQQVLEEETYKKLAKNGISSSGIKQCKNCLHNKYPKIEYKFLWKVIIS